MPIRYDDMKVRVMKVDLKVSQLLVSRVCHDLAGGIGALGTGAELLTEEQGVPDDTIVDLIALSAKQTKYRLQFLRMAFGLSGGQGSPQTVMTHDLHQTFRDYVEGGRISVTWNSQDMKIDIQEAKLVLNLCLIACEALPRGGVIDVNISSIDGRLGVGLSASGQNAHLISEFTAIICKSVDIDKLTPRNIHGHFTALLAASLRAELEVDSGDEAVVRLAVLFPAI